MKGFNALYRAYSISTQKKHLTSQQMEGCFNALYRAYSISTSAKIYGEIKIGDVSMPFIGLIPFLRSLAEKTGVSTNGVSMPFIGLIPFLLLLILVLVIDTMSFNALYRAYSISTQ